MNNLSSLLQDKMLLKPYLKKNDQIDIKVLT